jgi:formate dehydrogenase major subunit
VPPELVRRAARLYATASRPMMLHGLGVTEHYQGSESVSLLCNLAILVGAIGRPGVGVNPLLGQNDVQGAADMGCDPRFLPGYQAVEESEVRDKFESAWGRPLPTQRGLTIPEMHDAALRGEVRAMFTYSAETLCRPILTRIELNGPCAGLNSSGAGDLSFDDRESGSRRVARRQLSREKRHLHQR